MKSWAVPSTIVVAIEYVVALLIGWHVGFRYSIPFAAYLISSLVIVVLGFALFVAWKLIKARNGDVPLNLSRFLSFAVGVVLIALQMAVLTWTKVMLPIATAFWADPLLTDADKAIFGTDPWRLAQAAFGFAAPVIDWAYISWAPTMFVMLFVLVCLPESPKKSRALLSYFLVLFTGAIGQYALPSAGPLFHQPVPLEPWVAEAKAYLWADYLRGGGRIGTGISAMPSIHVAIALWIACVARSYLPRIQAPLFAWFGLILLGSVFLGWHYAVDSIAACLITHVAWSFGNTFVKQAASAPTRRPKLAGQISV